MDGSTGKDARLALGEAFYGIESARLQLGTLTHLSGDMAQSLAPLRRAADGVASFLCRKRNALLVAAVITAWAGLLNLARGWARMRSMIPR